MGLGSPRRGKSAFLFPENLTEGEEDAIGSDENAHPPGQSVQRVAISHSVGDVLDGEAYGDEKKP